MDQYSFFVLLVPLGCAITVVTAIYCFRHQNTPAAKPLGYTTLFTALYIIFNTLELTNPTEGGTVFFATICYACIGVVTVNWIRFALTFSERYLGALRKFHFLLYVVPVLAVVFAFTNSYHHLIWNSYEFIPVSHNFLYMKVTSYGSFFWVFWVQSYLLMIISAFWAIWTSITQRNRYRTQAILIAISSLFPLLVNSIYVLHLIPGLQKDFSPLAYALGGAIMAYSIFQYQLLELQPFARSIMIDEIADVMLTLDKEKRIIDFNRSSINVLKLKRGSRTVSPLVRELIFPYLDQFSDEPVNDLLKSEVKIDSGETAAYYDMQVRRLRNQIDGQVVGYLVLLHSITEHKNLLKEIRVMAEHDMLTGLYNRNYFEEAANRLIKVGEDEFSVLMIDIDFFKSVNDSVGHRAGDQVLQAISQKLQATLREKDIIGRFGGDEFVVLLPETSADNARVLADRLCAAVAAEPYQVKEGVEFSLSISIGISEFSGKNNNSLEQVIVQADQALYRAKSSGRNCAVIFTPDLAR